MGLKRIGCMAVHYGQEYIAWAVESLQVAVDEVHIFYTPTPSYGFCDPSLKVPAGDREDELYAAAMSRSVTPTGVGWHRLDGMTSESMHRNHMLEFAKNWGATTMTVVDADEVWDPSSLEVALREVENQHRAGRWLARFHNFWRSWEWTVRDSFTPVRIVDFRHSLQQDAYLDDFMQPLPVYHFGYAQTISTMQYKFSCHGHKAEFKKGWWENKFVPWTPTGDHIDLHPCVNNLWTAEPTDALTLAKVKFLLADHPHAGLSVIA